MGGEIREILGEILSRQEIKDPRVLGAGIITLSHVRMSGDLRRARVFFTAHGLDEVALKRVQKGLASAAGYMRHRIADRLRMKATPDLVFEIDRVFDEEDHIESLLREVREKSE